jgi:hypothetical protein
MSALTLQAEVVIGGLLVARHRAFHFAVALAFSLFLLAGASDAGAAAIHTMIVAAGSLGAVAGMRLLAPGAPLVSVRRVAATWWVPPAGRLAGAALFLAPVIAAGALGLIWPDEGWGMAVRAAILCWVFAATWAACTLALAPLLGAGSAGAIGLIAVWLGGISPSAVHQLLDGAVYLQRPAVLAWNVLPLGWRAARALSGSAGDWVLLVAWLAGGLVIGAWAASRTSDGGVLREGAA